MKKLSTLFILTVCTISLQAQIWQPLNGGLKYTPTAVTTIGEEHVVVAYKIADHGAKGNTFGVSYWNGIFWKALPTFSCDSGSRIHALRFFKNGLYIGGKFNKFNGEESASNLAVWNGKRYEIMDSPGEGSTSTKDVVMHLNEYDNLLVIGGLFPNNKVSGGQNLAFYNGTEWVSSGIKELENVNNTVTTTAFHDNNFYIGGGFTKVGLTRSLYLARFQGGELAPFDLNKVRPYKIVAAEKLVVVAGSNQTNSEPTYFYRLDNDSAYKMINGFDKILAISDLVSDGKIIYASGEFYFNGSDDPHYIAKFENEKWQPVGNPILMGVNRLGVLANSLVATGKFTSYRNIQLNYIAQIRKEMTVGAIKGRVYFDKNENCRFDGNDENLNDKVIRIQPGNIFIRPRINGSYIAYLEPGKYDVSIVPSRYWSASSCGKLKQTIEVQKGKLLDSLDFSMVQRSGIKDLSIKLLSSTGPKVNVNNKQQYFINYENLGSSELVAGTVSLKFDSRLSSLQAFPRPTNVIGDSAIWDIADLSPGEKGKIRCLFDVNGTVNDDLELIASISQPQTEDDEYNNTSSLTQQIVDQDIEIQKFVNPGLSWSDTAYVNPNAKSIQYQVSFANYTDDTVRSVYVIDTIIINSSIASIDDIAFSHYVVDASYPGPPFSNYYILVYKFENINLPPNPSRNGEIVTDEGHASFQLSLKDNLTDGQQFINTASVVFDYSFDKQTNTVFAIVDEDLVSAPKTTLSELGIDAYPNPSKGIIQLTPSEEDFSSYELIAMDGSVAYAGKMKSDNDVIDISSLETGVYTLRLKSKKGTYRTRVLKL